MEIQANQTVIDDHQDKSLQSEHGMIESSRENVENVKISDPVPEKKEAWSWKKLSPQQKRTIKYQTLVWILSFVGLLMIQMEREFWSLSKTYITKERADFPKTVLSRFDSVQLFCFAVGMYIAGTAGDIINQRYLVSAAYVGLAIAVMMAGLAGTQGIWSQGYFFVTFALIGLCNSLITPTFCAVMGRWFPKKNRGLLVGIWSTTNNFGHILGIQFSAALMRVYTPQWGYLMETMAGILLFTAVVIYVLLVSDPKYVNIDIAELQGGSEIRLHKLESGLAIEKKVNKIIDADMIAAGAQAKKADDFFGSKS